MKWKLLKLIDVKTKKKSVKNDNEKLKIKKKENKNGFSDFFFSTQQYQTIVMQVLVLWLAYYCIQHLRYC